MTKLSKFGGRSIILPTIKDCHHNPIKEKTYKFYTMNSSKINKSQSKENKSSDNKNEEENKEKDNENNDDYNDKNKGDDIVE